MKTKTFHLLIFVIYSGETRVTTPTAIETQLPWKRDEADAEALQQNEFPAWASNKEYLAYNSPSATFLGNLLFLSECFTFSKQEKLNSIHSDTKDTRKFDFNSNKKKSPIVV